MDNKYKGYTGYLPAEKEWWSGRVDGDQQEQLRWHQWIELLHIDNLTVIEQHNALVFIGFCCDEGVRRNKGRIGAAEAPRAIRQTCSNLPVFGYAKKIYDIGNILCINETLEEAQMQLADAVKNVLLSGNFPIVLGGGHEITYGHYQGIKSFLQPIKDKKVGIVNFDAHFDLRPVENNMSTSGTGFWQIAQECQREGIPFNYLALGIQKTSNTAQLFNIARSLGVTYQSVNDFSATTNNSLQNALTSFIALNDSIYLTIDMDVFAAPYAPGVSAPAYNGILPDNIFFDCLRLLIHSKKVVSIDIAELNPELDIDKRTAKLAATILFEIVEMIGN
ncbi:formimidoylglutamase [Olivibacter domesticus]|uniref:Formimidoylglutamase n=1 Tax=Olivibacter domesticus TaxID=407022 RepID=A0A1H7HP87_OLID1|nr:formimidoylglutamase [Olivibacter domesticus]SEK52014.1 formiminoglutamase [Olivibacter domesticus]